MAYSSSGVIKIISDENEKTRRNGRVMSCAEMGSGPFPVVYIRRPGNETAYPRRAPLREFVAYKWPWVYRLFGTLADI